MCIQYFATYDCGCRCEYEFVQCDQFRHTNMKCSDRDIEDVAQEPIPHYCKAHLVPIDEDEVDEEHQDEEDEENQDEEDEEYQDEEDEEYQDEENQD